MPHMLQCMGLSRTRKNYPFPNGSSAPMKNTISDIIFSIFSTYFFFPKSLPCILSHIPYGSGSTLITETFN